MRLRKLFRALAILPAVKWHKFNIAIYQQGIDAEEKRVAEAPDRLRIWREQLAEEKAALAILQDGVSSRVRYERDRVVPIHVSPKVHQALRAALDHQGASHVGPQVRNVGGS